VLRPRDPSRHGPPLMIAGRRPRMLQLAARYADAWNSAWHVEPSMVRASYEEFQQACAIVGRDATTVELTLGTLVNLFSAGEQGGQTNAISGPPDVIARRLANFAQESVRHVIVMLDPLTPESIEQFGQIADLVRQYE
jgi:alkanesulfonate monooxygenase SsuD/methylene tetrahydromethanopterin reductase-like flavin-dependent oxidoreductase (luciferase family)